MISSSRWEEHLSELEMVDTIEEAIGLLAPEGSPLTWRRLLAMDPC